MKYISKLKFLLLQVAICYSTLLSFGQTNQDSLLIVWKNENSSDQSKLKAWVEMTNISTIKRNDLKELITDFHKQFDASSDPYFQVYKHLVNGIDMFYLSNNPAGAVVEFKSMENLAKKSKFPKEVAMANALLGKTSPETESKVYYRFALDYLLNHPEDEVVQIPAFGRLDNFVFTTYVRFIEDSIQANIEFYESVCTFCEKKKDQELLISYLIQAGNKIWQNHKLADESIAFFQRAIDLIDQSQIELEKKPMLAQHIEAIKAGNPRRISVSNAQSYQVKCIQPKPATMKIVKTEKYSREEYAFELTDSIVDFHGDTLLRSNFLPPEELLGRIDTIIAGVPKRVTALPPQFTAEGYLDFKQMSVYHGLPTKLIPSMAQDSKGNFWMSTTLELVRYDGANFYVYSKDQGLPETYYGSILIDRHDNVWIESNDGILKYDGKHFILYSEFFNSNQTGSFLEDSNGDVWFCNLQSSQGAIKFQNDKIFRYGKDQGLYNRISFMYESKDGVWWFGTDNFGLYRMDSICVVHYTIKNGLPSWSVYSFGEDEYGNELFINYNSATGRDFLCKVKNGNLNLYSNKAHSETSHFFIDSKGNVWIDCVNHLLKWSKHGTTYFDHHEGYTESGNRFMFEDRSGRMWFGKESGGILVYSDKGVGGLPFLKNARTITPIGGNGYDITSFHDYPSRYHNGNKESYEMLETDGTRIRSGFTDSKGNQWIGAWGGGLYKYDGVKLHHYTTESGIPNAWITCITEDFLGNIWFGSYGGGVTKFDGVTFTIYPYLRSGDQNGEGLISPSVISIMQASDSSMWFGTNNGLCQLKNGKYTYFRPQDGSPGESHGCIVEKKDGTIMVSSGKGMFSIKNNSFEYTSKIHHFGENGLAALIEDKKGNIWSLSDKGIGLWTGKKFIQYDGEDGYRGIGEYNMSADARMDNNGLIWFGSTASFSLDPEKLLSEDWELKPTLELYELKLFGKSVNFRLLKAGIKDSTILEADQMDLSQVLFGDVVPFKDYPTSLILPYDVNDLSFVFSGYDWRAQYKLVYSYRLVGSNDVWSEPSKIYEARFNNLDYGNYTFEVKVQNRYGIWSEPVSYSFEIKPPWWHTMWARSSYAAMGIFFILGYGRFRTRNLKEKQKLLVKEVKSATKEFRLEKLKAEKEKMRAERSEAFKQQFLANMSHEIRTPMNAVLGMTSLTLDTKLNEKQHKYLSAVKKSSENLLVIINDILDLSKLEAGKMELEKIPFFLKEQLDVVQDTLRFKAEEKSLQFSVQIANDVPEVLVGDPSRLNQILINLGGNSIKFTEKGSVQLLVELVKGTTHTLKFRVIDTGIGIPKDKTSQLFSAFQQVDASTSRKYGGTGLGLSISKTLVELQKGEIGIESEVGVGTEFYFTIEYQPANENTLAKMESDKVIDGSNLKGIRILVAEDNDFNQIVINDTIKQLIEDAHVVVRPNGLEIIEELKKNEYDLVLMDVNMPEMDGHEASKKIRAGIGEKFQSIPIIALTASVLSTDIHRCLDSGMNDYIPKPFTRPQLLKTIGKFYSNEGKTNKEQKNKKKLVAKSAEKPEKFMGTSLEFLFNHCKGDEQKMKMIIQLYLKNTPLNLEKISEALKNKDLDLIRKTAHSMKPQLGYMGLNDAMQIADEIELSCVENKSVTTIGKLAKKLTERCKTSISELEKIVNQLQA